MPSALKEKLLHRLKNEYEIYILMLILAAWYLLNIGGAMKGDETIFSLQGYYFIKGNMPAEQYRPMSRYFYGLGQLIFGRTTFGAKFFIFLFGIFTVYLTYRVAKDLSNRIYGFFAALILGIIPLYGDLSVSGLMEIILTFFVMLLLFFAVRCFRTEDIIKKQRLLFLIGVLSICTLTTKLYGVFFSLVVFLFLLHSEWKTMKTIELFKRKNLAKRFKKNLFLVPIFVILGVLFGLLTRAQLSDFWENAGEKGRADVLDLLPSFLDNIVLNMDGDQAYGFFIALGIIIFIVLWLISALVGRESLRTLKCLVKKRALDEKYNILIYILGAIIGFAIIYSPFLSNPVTLFTHIMLGQTVHIKQGSPREVAGVLYERPPWWSYMYWAYISLGVMFVVGLITSLCYTAYRFIKKEKVAKELNFLFLFTFLPFVLFSVLNVKAHHYFAVLFPLFSIYMVLQVTSLVNRLCRKSSIKSIKSRAKLLSIGSIVLLILLPGPLWMTLDEPELGHDSRYDVVGELVVDYSDGHSGEDIRIIAFDELSVEFYLPDEVLKDVEIIPLFSDNYSYDTLGRPHIYYSDGELYNLVLNDEIDMFIDEPDRMVDRETLIRNYAAENYTAINRIKENLIVYYFTS